MHEPASVVCFLLAPEVKHYKHLHLVVVAVVVIDVQHLFGGLEYARRKLKVQTSLIRKKTVLVKYGNK